jgi:exopolysaccharide production protein ExoZ
MSAAPTQPLWSVQYLRAIAACAVLLSHIQDLIPAYVGYFDFGNGRCGVDIFFVISGFIMVTAARADSGRDFLARRIIRIVPLYWLLTLALAAVGILMPHLLHYIRVTPSGVAQSVLFIPHMMGTEIGPLLQPGWTLNYEMAFYLVFAMFFSIPITHRVAVIGAVFTTLVVIGILFGANTGPIAFKTYTNPLLLEFVAGMALGLLVQNNKRLPLWLSGIAILGGITAICILPYSETLRLFYFGLPAMAIVYGAISLEHTKPIRHIGWLRALGDGSYSLYLTHLLTLGVVRVIWKPVFNTGTLIECMCFIATCICAAVIVGQLTYLWIEHPMTQALNRAYLNRARTGLWFRAGT